ncbi:MAG: hypothetical protein Q8O86_11820 [Dehalococcoidia bacterium]|nr:hypothetical protein [Dehalococcoidia bacterium]
MNRIPGVAGAILLITLLTLGVGWHPDLGVSAASCSVSGAISTDTAWSPATCDPPGNGPERFDTHADA